MQSDESFNKLDKARQLLELGTVTTIDEIKKHYKDSVKKTHPDTNKHDPDAHWKMVEVNQAYEVVVKYCQNYKFKLTKEEFSEQNPMNFEKGTDIEYTTWWQNSYGNDPLWGRENKE